ncbi:MAG: transcriptional regulator [Pseudomonadota bacterium]
MANIRAKKIHETTGDYEAWLHQKLQDKEEARVYLQVALDTYQKDRNKKAFLLALKDVAEAQGGIRWLAEKTHLNREHLYYLLSGKGNPRFDTLSLIFKIFGFHLNIEVD